MTWIEAIAVVFGLVCVLLTIRQSIWCWPIGLVQVALYIFIFYRVRLYSELVLHVIYVLLLVYGWCHWLHGGRDQGKLEVSRIPLGALVLWIAMVFASTGVWGWGMASFTDAAVPYWDAFITVASLIAQWLMTRKRLEAWLFWMSVDVVAIGVYIHKSLLMTSGLYAVFLIMATMGYLTWRRSISARLETTVSDEDGLDPWKIRPTAQGASVVD